MKITIQKLVDQQNSIGELLNTEKIPKATGFRLKPIVRQIEQHLKDFQESQNEIGKTYGYLDATGKKQTPTDEQKELANIEFKGLLQQEVELHFEPITSAELGDANPKPALLIDLDWLIVE